VQEAYATVTGPNSSFSRKESSMDRSIKQLLLLQAITIQIKNKADGKESKERGKRMGKKLRRGEKIIPFQTTNYQVLSG
jgi:hypothetical protein